MSTALRVLLLLGPHIGTLVTDISQEYDIVTGKAKGTPSQKAENAISDLEDILSLLAKIV